MYNTNTPDVVLERESRELTKVNNIFNKIRSKGLELTNEDLMGYGGNVSNNTVTKTILTENEIYAGLSAEEAAELRGSQALFEDEPTNYSTHSSILGTDGAPIQRKQTLTERAPQRPVMRGTTWSAKKLRAKLTNGEIVPVWKVTDSQSGMEMPTNFRIEEVAERVADILNESGNVNDPRVVSTTAAYNKRVKLIKEMKVTKQAASEGDIKAKRKLSVLKEDIAAVDYKLGI